MLHVSEPESSQETEGNVLVYSNHSLHHFVDFLARLSVVLSLQYSSLTLMPHTWLKLNHSLHHFVDFLARLSVVLSLQYSSLTLMLHTWLKLNHSLHHFVDFLARLSVVLSLQNSSLTLMLQFTDPNATHMAETGTFLPFE